MKENDRKTNPFSDEYNQKLVDDLSKLGFVSDRDTDTGCLLVQSPVEAIVIHWSGSKVPDDLTAKANEVSELATRFGKNRATILVTPLMLNDDERNFFQGQTSFLLAQIQCWARVANQKLLRIKLKPI